MIYPQWSILNSMGKITYQPVDLGMFRTHPIDPQFPHQNNGFFRVFVRVPNGRTARKSWLLQQIRLPHGAGSMFGNVLPSQDGAVMFRDGHVPLKKNVLKFLGVWIFSDKWIETDDLAVPNSGLECGSSWKWAWWCMMLACDSLIFRIQTSWRTHKNSASCVFLEMMMVMFYPLGKFQFSGRFWLKLFGGSNMCSPVPYVLFFLFSSVQVASKLL